MAPFLQEHREVQLMPYVPVGQAVEQSEPCNHDHKSVFDPSTHIHIHRRHTLFMMMYLISWRTDTFPAHAVAVSSILTVTDLLTRLPIETRSARLITV